MASIFHPSNAVMCVANPGLTLTHILPDGSKTTMVYQPHNHVQNEQVELLDLVNPPVMGGSVVSPLSIWREDYGAGARSSKILEPEPDMAQVSEPAAGGGEAPKPKRKPAGKRIPCPEFNDLPDAKKQDFLRSEVREAIDVPFEGLEYLLTLDNKGLSKSPRNIFITSLGMSRLETINLQQSVSQYGRRKAELVLKEVKEIVNR
jgi:hypothetical protein